MTFNCFHLITFPLKYADRRRSSIEYGSVVPLEQLAYVGSSVNITCHSHISPLWTKRGGFADIVELSNDRMVLYIPQILESHSGTYTCYGTNEKDMYFIKKARVHVGCE